MKNKIITISFVMLLFLTFLFNLLVPAQEFSASERRQLAQLPTASVEGILSGEVMEEFDDYINDQFIFRDYFRALKATFEFKLFKKLDNNDIYLVGDGVYKLEYPLKLDRVDNMANYLNRLNAEFLQDSNVYYAVIPDKNYYVPVAKGYPTLDYKLMIERLTYQVKDMSYINLFDTLTIADYYRTDTHWRQEGLGLVAKRLADEMKFVTDPSKIKYDRREYSPFYGVYYGQSALNIQPDEIIYLESDWTREAIVENSEHKGEAGEQPGIYDLDRLGGRDSYDLFLSGATALTTIKNPNSLTEKELVMFRDSFAGSLVPLLLEEYSKITLVDTRYMSSSLLAEEVDFQGKDVLFLYSTLVVNNSNILR